MVTILNGPLGSELNVRGVATPEPFWSAQAIEDAPEIIAAIHRDYVAAGATVHTTNTFRTKRRSVGAQWEKMARKAVEIARLSVPQGQCIAGGIAPLEDCYRPDLSPSDPREEHREVCRLLADAGVDILLCETFPHVGEALVATEEAVATGLPTWVSFTAGPDADLLTPDEVERGAREAVARGASVVLFNCTRATKSLPYVERLSRVGVPFGVYANAGPPEDGLGWTDSPDGPERYAVLAAEWVRLGAKFVGACCGLGPAHIRALQRFV
jgi:S-methylmethionine-dependent homocysteine/selenocysteine methylase